MPTCRIQALYLLIAALVLIGVSGCRQPVKINPQQSPTIALLSDFGENDSYVAEMKGAILSVNPAINIVDLTHSIEPFNIKEAAYLVDRMAASFPAGTVFVGVVDPGVGSSRLPILVQTKEGKFYIGPDNGIFGLVISREGFNAAWQLTNAKYFNPKASSETFHGRDIFSPAAAHLVSGIAPEDLGRPISRGDLTLPPITSPTIAGANIVAEVLHLDRFGNVLTNIPEGFTPLLKQGKLARVTINKKTFTAPLVKTFSDVDEGRLVLLYGGQGVLEIAKNKGSASEELKAKVGDRITIRP